MKTFLTTLLVIIQYNLIIGQNLGLDWVYSQRTGVRQEQIIMVDSNQNIFLASNPNNYIDIDPGPDTLMYSSNGLIQKLDSLQELIWYAPIPGRIRCATLDHSGNIYVAGSFKGRQDFDPTGDTLFLQTPIYPIFPDRTSVFISKFSSNGEFLWAKTIGSNSDDYAKHIVVDPDNNVVINGVFSHLYPFEVPDYYPWHTTDSIDLNPNTGSQIAHSRGNDDIFILKLDSTGEFVWAKAFGSNKIDRINGLAINSLGDIYSYGSFKNSININPNLNTPLNNLTTMNSRNGFIQRLNTNGNFISGHNMVQEGFRYGYTLKIDNNDDLILSGSFIDTLDLGINSTPQELISNTDVNDIFVLKMDSNYIINWGFSIIGLRTENIKDMVIGDDNSIYSIGTFDIKNFFWNIQSGTPVDFNPGVGVNTLTSLGDDDVFIQIVLLCIYLHIGQYK